MQEWKISFCFQKANHEKHKEPDAKALQYKIHISFKEKVAFIGAIVIKLLCKKHDTEKKCIRRIIKKFPVPALEKISQGKQDHH